LRLNEDLSFREAIEVPREVIVERFGERRCTWAKHLEADPLVSKIVKLRGLSS
jgi:hypothetical protein